MHRRPSLLVEAAHKKLKCNLAHCFDWLSDDRDRRRKKSGEGKIVDSDNGYVARARKVQRLYRSHGCNEQPPARSKNSSGSGVLGKNGMTGFGSLLVAERPTDD